MYLSSSFNDTEDYTKKNCKSTDYVVIVVVAT